MTGGGLEARRFMNSRAGQQDWLLDRRREPRGSRCLVLQEPGFEQRICDVHTGRWELSR